ncbi:MAG: penicillin acylase family protein [Polyangiaceae bacterium]
MGTLLTAVALLGGGCGEDEMVDGGRTSGPPANSPFAANRDPDEVTKRPGINKPVEIVTDEFGVPHIFAENEKDAIYANGYIHARDRLFLMDAFRMLGQGRVAERLGDAGLPFDLTFRATFMTADGTQVADAVVAQLPAETIALLDAYSAGVNAYLAELRAGKYKLPPSYGTPLLKNVTAADIDEWQPRDTIAVARVMEWQLTDGGGDFDQYIAERIQKLPPDLFADLVRFQPSDPTVILPNWFGSAQKVTPSEPSLLGLNPKDPRQLAAYAKAQKSLAGIDFSKITHHDSPLLGGGIERDSIGSNNWVIGGEHTESGYPIIANDPHLAFVQPAQFHHAQIDTALYGGDTGTSAIGISVAGVSGIVIGHTQHVAWGGTVVGWDVTDIYVETLNDAGDAVLFNGEYVPIKRYEQTFKIGVGAAAREEKQTIEYVPHHGPILDGSKGNGKALTIKWTGRMLDNEVKGVIGLLHSKSVDEWAAALDNMTVLAQNWNGADDAGNTAYHPHALIPVRKSVTGDCAPYKPMDGTGPCEWEGFIPDDRIPQNKNRENGWLVTANNDVAGTLQDNDPTNDPQYLVAERAIGFRAGRITQLIEEQIAAGKKFTLEDVQKIQADNLSLEAERMRDFLLAAADALPARVTELNLTDAIERIRNWKLTTPSGVAADYRTDSGPSAEEIDESVASSIFFAWLPRFRNSVFDDELKEYGTSLGSTDKARAMFNLLEHPDLTATGTSLFDDVTTTDVVETKDELMLQAMADALTFLAGKDAFNSSDMTTWRWGQLHGMQIKDLFGLFSDTAFITRGPYPRGGSNYTVDVAGQGGSTTNFIYGSGPQMRFVAELRPDGIVSRNALPGGQSDDPESKHYEDLLQMWLRNESFPYYFKPEDVALHMETYELFSPEK